MGLEWYPESGDDIYEDEPGKPVYIHTDNESQSGKNTEYLAEEAQREQAEAEELFAQYEMECLEEEA